MSTTLAKLELDHDRHWHREDDLKLSAALEAEGLTHAVVVVDFQCDDETCMRDDAAERMGLLPLVVCDSVLDGKTHLGEYALPTEQVLGLDGDRAVIRQIPFRLRIWSAISTQS